MTVYASVNPASWREVMNVLFAVVPSNVSRPSKLILSMRP
jgi:hypothetical protein